MGGGIPPLFLYAFMGSIRIKLPLSLPSITAEDLTVMNQSQIVISHGQGDARRTKGAVQVV
jgi:hypothetical protein